MYGRALPDVSDFLSMLVLSIHSLVVNHSIERYEISMPCGSGVNLHFITSAARHDCVLLQVQQC